MSKLNVVVTGGASGIGESVVRNVVEAGGTAVIADLQEERGQALRQELGDAVRFQRVDVTAIEDLYAATALAEDQFGPLTGMVNNAGVVGAIGSILDTTAEQYDRTMAILARGVFFGIQAAGRCMKPHGGGSIVSLASTAGMIGGLGPHVYTMAKHGVVGLTKSAAAELSRSGIRVNAVAPGSTVTPMTAALADNDEQRISDNIAEVSPLGFAPVAQDMANAIMFCLGEESRYMNGHTLVIDAGQTTGSDWQPMFFSTPSGLL
jgi:NAD(P)-dependent dehydrogenase (short-subunit alcohol dehydrogenase family)